jgi:tellurite resistance protein
MTDTGTAVALTPAAQDRALPPAPLSGMPGLSRFGIPLGLAGLGGGWSAARSSLGSPMWPEEILYGEANSLWLILTASTCFGAFAGKEHSGQTCDTKWRGLSRPSSR